MAALRALRRHAESQLETLNYSFSLNKGNHDCDNVWISDLN